MISWKARSLDLHDEVVLLLAKPLQNTISAVTFVLSGNFNPVV